MAYDILDPPKDPMIKIQRILIIGLVVLIILVVAAVVVLAVTLGKTDNLNNLNTEVTPAPQAGTCTKDTLVIYYFYAWSSQVNFTSDPALQDPNSAAYQAAVNTLQMQLSDTLSVSSRRSRTISLAAQPLPPTVMTIQAPSSGPGCLLYANVIYTGADLPTEANVETLLGKNPTQLVPSKIYNESTQLCNQLQKPPDPVSSVSTPSITTTALASTSTSTPTTTLPTCTCTCPAPTTCPPPPSCPTSTTTPSSMSSPASSLSTSTVTTTAPITTTSSAPTIQTPSPSGSVPPSQASSLAGSSSSTTASATSTTTASAIAISSAPTTQTPLPSSSVSSSQTSSAASSSSSATAPVSATTTTASATAISSAPTTQTLSPSGSVSPSQASSLAASSLTTASATAISSAPTAQTPLSGSSGSPSQAPSPAASFSTISSATSTITGTVSSSLSNSLPPSTVQATTNVAATNQPTTTGATSITGILTSTVSSTSAESTSTASTAPTTTPLYSYPCLRDIAIAIDYSTAIGTTANAEMEVAFVGSSLIINWTLADNNIWVAPIFFQDKVPFDDLPMPYINGLTLLNATMNTILKAWQIQGTANLTSLLTTYKQKYLTAAGGESARDGVPKTLIILSASAAPDDVSSASQIALELIKQNITIITVALGPNVVSANQLQPISSGAAFSFQSDLGSLPQLVSQIVSVVCLLPSQSATTATGETMGPSTLKPSTSLPSTAGSTPVALTTLVPTITDLTTAGTISSGEATTAIGQTMRPSTLEPSTSLPSTAGSTPITLTTSLPTATDLTTAGTTTSGEATTAVSSIPTTTPLYSYPCLRDIAIAIDFSTAIDTMETAFIGNNLMINWTLADNNIRVAPIFFQDEVPLDDLPMPYLNGINYVNSIMNTIVQAWPIQGTPNLTSLLTTYGQQYLTAAGGQNARDGISKTLIILSASADPSDVNSAAAIAKGYQGVTIITIGIEPNVASSTPLQPISSGTGFAFSAILNNLASLVPQVVSAACMQPPAPPLSI